MDTEDIAVAGLLVAGVLLVTAAAWLLAGAAAGLGVAGVLLLAIAVAYLRAVGFFGPPARAPREGKE